MNVNPRLSPSIEAESASVADIPQPVLSRFVSGQRGISMDNASKIAAAFGMRLTKPKSLRVNENKQ